MPNQGLIYRFNMHDTLEITGSSKSDTIPFRLWWGLGFCAAAMGLIFAFAPYSEGILLAPDKGDFWYFWQLQDPTAITRLSAWLPYIIHQVSIWLLIYQAQQIRPSYIFGLHSFNVWAIGINAFFILLHIVQTKYFYDGLAQDVHEATSMMSVVVMLFMILIMENRRRGLFFGKSIPAMFFVGDALRRYHGYYFSWAIIYTFWYHPVEITSGHLAGFAYMFLLLLQSSLFFTRYHTNRWWTMFLEVVFVVHGALVAAFIMNPGEHEFWSMFLFGGMGIFLITQLHGLGLDRRGKLALGVPVVAVIASFYAIYPEYLVGLARIPATMYLGSFLLWLILLAFILAGERIRRYFRIPSATRSPVALQDTV
jgi:hypothetical protein